MIYLTREQSEILHSLPKPRCPRYLSPEARAIWKATAPGLKRKGHLTALDGNTFANYCCAVASHRLAVNMVRQSRGRNRKLWAGIERGCRRVANMYAREFYLPKMPRLDEAQAGKVKRNA